MSHDASTYFFIESFLVLWADISWDLPERTDKQLGAGAGLPFPKSQSYPKLNTVQFEQEQKKGYRFPDV